MSTELEQARLIAERIARRMSGVSGTQSNSASSPASKSDIGAELAALRVGLSELQNRLAQIEAKVGSDAREPAAPVMTYNASPLSRADQPVLTTHSPWLAGVNASVAHPSQERFGVEEAVVSELVDYFEKDKICSVEPGGKPCDHCAMCSSRGF